MTFPAQYTHIQNALKVDFGRKISEIDDTLPHTIGEICIGDLFFDPQTPRKLVESITSELEYLSLIASRSFLHPTDAIKVPLTPTTRSRPEIRIHFWHNQPPASGRDYDIHDHKWSFFSRALGGDFVHEIWREASSSRKLHKSKMVSKGAWGQNEVVDCGTVGVELLSSTYLSKDNTYYLSSSALHSFVAISSTPATIIVRSPYEKSHTSILRNGPPRSDAQGDSPKRGMVNADKLAMMLLNILEK